MMKTISTEHELIENIKTLKHYLANKNDEQFKKAVALVKKGTCFVVYQTEEEEACFVPSRFIGYLKNTLEKHNHNAAKHGGETNHAISSVLASQPLANKKFESEYKKYCIRLGISPNKTGPFGNKRKFWLFNLNSGSGGKEGFPEGGIVERQHKTRERNSSVVQLAKSDFKSKHGTLYCEACGFDFHKHYGALGRNFIEAHHTVPVSEMSKGDKTRPEDIVLLCSNCHSMVHRKRPCLSVKELKKLIVSSSKKIET